MKKKIFIAGHNGMVGSAIVRKLEKHHINHQLILASRSELDLANQQQVEDFFKIHAFDQVYLAAAKVGGIYANNTYPAEFIYQNLMIQSNIIHAAYLTGVRNLLFLGSSCIYPKMAAQPIQEEALLTGGLELTNEPYAVAKIAGIKLCESYNRQYGVDYRSIMPTNLYGANDNFHLENAHVIPSLMRRIHEAKLGGLPEVLVWGSGTPMREFLHVDDMAEASIYVMNLDAKTYQECTDPMLSHINVGTGKDCTIEALVEIMIKVIGYKGRITFDSTKPDGTLRKLLDVSRIKSLGWEPSISLKQGLTSTYNWFIENQSHFRK